ncbi:MAG: PAS domain S-box protein [Pirellulales bacterium]|nr:PAS domain S-box protein [Pirellulales bacterium]
MEPVVRAVVGMVSGLPADAAPWAFAGPSARVPLVAAAWANPFFWASAVLAVACGLLAVGLLACRRRLARDAARRIAEAAPRAERNRDSQFLDMAGVILVAIDRDGTIALLNRRGHEILGYDNGELVGRNWFETCVPEEERDSVRAVFYNVFAGRLELAERHENSVLLRSGQRRWIAWHNALLRDDDGLPVWSLSSGEDVTERRHYERERESLVREFESQNAELERFTYMVSHDLKSPLITVKGYMGLLRQDIAGGNAEAAEDDLARMSSAADRMELLLGELLELSRIGRLVNPPRDIALSDLAREAVDLVAGQIGQRGVDVAIADDLPVVHGDRMRLLEVFQNLVDNAVKYMGDQPCPRIEIGVRRQAGPSCVYVRDNGIGIEPRYHERVFGLFDKLDARSEGAGVGLALVRRIVEVHQGRIWVESEGTGRGATFVLSLPEVEPAASQRKDVLS